MIIITSGILLDEREIEERFTRSSGPGGQNVNKVSTAVQLRFDVRHSVTLPPAVKCRLAKQAGSRMTDEGILVIEAQRFRTQRQNRADALNRLVALVRAAARPPKPRRPTTPTLASRLRQRQTKNRHSEKKLLRKKTSSNQE